MNAAERVISKFGGPIMLAKLLGRDKSMVQAWADAGAIPAKWHAALVILATKSGITLSAEDLLTLFTQNGQELPELERGRSSSSIFSWRTSGIVAACAVFLVGLGIGATVAWRNMSGVQPAQQAQQVQQAGTAPPADESWFTYATHDNWKTRCRNGANSSNMKVMCVGILEIEDTTNHRRVVTWVLGRNSAGGFVSNLQIPNGVQVSQGLALQFDTGKTYQTAFTGCEPEGCSVNGVMAADFIDAGRAAKMANITAYTSEGQAVSLHVPVGGFDAVIHDIQ